MSSRALSFALPIRWVLIFAASFGPALGYDAKFYAVDVQVLARVSPPSLVFSWPAVEHARQYTVRRKAPNDSWWGGATILPGNSTGFTDSNVSLGTAYEYEIQMETTEPALAGGFLSAFGYVFAGVDLRERDQRGKAILVVDRSIAAAIAAELEIFRSDLIGDGWTVVQREVSRTDSVQAVKNLIRGEYEADRANARAVILIGHVPVPYSGNIAPDMHGSHRGAWPADAYYGEMDGPWTDSSVSVRSGEFPENDNFPGDGKFDQSVFPSPVDLEVGRIDFWELPAFAPRGEIDLLRNYFRKNHAFRHRQFTAPRLGLIHDHFGDLDNDAPAVDAWRHYGLFFGRDRVREIGPDAFFPTLRDEGFLWAYGGGGGANDKADGVGSTYDFAANDPRAVFFILHGSYFGDWNYPDNFLRAAIATPTYALASIWSGLPHWFMHHLALGETLGYSARLSANNLSTYRSHSNFSPGEVHVSLIGDPTLQIYPVIPPAGLSATASQNVELRWTASTDDHIVGYHLYYATAQTGPYTRLTVEPVTSASYTHAVGAGVHYYMARAVKLETTGSGTFRNLSQGIFASVQKSSGGISVPPLVSVSTELEEASEFRSKAGTFLISRDGGGADPLTIYFRLSGSAVSGVDYLPIDHSVTIPAGSSSALVYVYPKTDDLEEGDETVRLELDSGTGYRLSPASSATIVIRDYLLNRPPSAEPQALAAIRGVPESIVLQGADPDGSPVQFTILRPPERGTLSGNPPHLIYIASEDSGIDSLTFAATDGTLVSPPATVSLSLHPRPAIRGLRPVDGGVALEYSAPPGRPLLVETSSDTLRWDALGSSAANEVGEGQFIDRQTGGVAIKLYRLHLE